MPATKKSTAKKKPAAKKRSVARPSSKPSVEFKKYFGRLKSINRPRIYLFGALAFLGLSTIFWSWLSARLQLSNADQLINTYLFQNSTTWHGAYLPSTHTFLIKWPLFWLIHLLGARPILFTLSTIGLSLTTVGCLAWSIYKIERRPYVFGTLMLLLSSALIMVPAVPYPGALLPVNMAMVATRNIEYILYILSLVFIFRATKVHSKSFLTGLALLGLLIASDKLFLTLSLGGAIMMLGFYGIWRNFKAVTTGANWLVASLGAAGLAAIALYILNSIGFVHIASQSGYSPYGLVSNAHNLGLAIAYGLLGIATNLGANPGAATTTLKDVPHIAAHQAVISGLLIYLINFVTLIVGLVAATKLVWTNRHHVRTLPSNTTDRLALGLVASSLTAFLVYIATNHFYPVDDRYLAIFSFTTFIILALWARTKDWHSRRLAYIGAAAVIAVVIAVPALIHNYHKNRLALSTYDSRNALVARVLSRHHVDYLVGDYWRVTPIKLASHNSINIVPLASCTSQRDILSSSNMQADLDKHSFAYLLSLDKGLTDYPTCSIDQVDKVYGRPNTSVIIAGSQENPQEILLFYDKGALHSAPKISLSIPSTILPISLDALPYTSCPTGTTIMNVVAHQDDDLLFMNPDTLNLLNSDHCIRTVYMTAGDSGGDRYYWLSREQAAEAAYSQMLKTNAVWVQRIVKLSDHEYINVAHPRNDYRAALVFIRLPDGNLGGQGFIANSFESLAHLRDGRTSTIHSVDGQSYYSKDQLVDALALLMHAYQPNEIHTQSQFVSRQFPDHNDHIQTGWYARDALKIYLDKNFESNADIPIKYYIGYPVHGMSANVSGSDLTAKMAAFFAYGNVDREACSDLTSCQNRTTYSFYLSRQYQNPN